MKENFRQSETERICLQQTHSKSKTKSCSSGRRKVIINRTQMKGGMKSNGKCKYVSRSKMEHDIRFKDTQENLREEEGLNTTTHQVL